MLRDGIGVEESSSIEQSENKKPKRIAIYCTGVKEDSESIEDTISLDFGKVRVRGILGYKPSYGISISDGILVLSSSDSNYVYSLIRVQRGSDDLESLDLFYRKGYTIEKTEDGVYSIEYNGDPIDSMRLSKYCISDTETTNYEDFTYYVLEECIGDKDFDCSVDIGVGEPNG